MAQDVLRRTLECLAAAQPLTSTNGHPQSTAQGDSDEDYEQKLEDCLVSLDIQLKQGARASKRRDEDAASVAELAEACKATCGRLLALTKARTAKRINTSPGFWKNANGNSRNGLELRRLGERMLELLATLTAETGKSLSSRLSGTKKQLRQTQLDLQRMQCQKSERTKAISTLLKDLESQARGFLHGSAKTLTPTGLADIEAKIAEMTFLQACVKQDIGVLRSLAFRNSVARHDAIPQAHQQTFSWVFADEQQDKRDPAKSGLLNWLENGSGIFWVSGKPGAGKSTLMKYIADHEKTREALQRWSAPKPVVIVSHYFWCAGAGMQRSHYGLLRTLLFEILRHFPDEISTWLPSFASQSRQSKAFWTIDELSQALLNITERADLPVKICILIDGLDEFDGDHLALCHQLMALAKFGNAKLCLSSRPWSVFTEAFGSGVIPQLCLHDVTRNDILAYAQNRLLQGLDIDDKDAIADMILINQITDKAQGVFLWPSLVTDLMLERLSEDRAADLHQVLQECPSDLDELFTSRLQAVDPENAPKMASSLLISVEAERPLDVGVYFFHDMEYDNAEYVMALSADPPSKLEHRKQLADTTKKLEARCQKLLDVERTSNAVNFLHRTVRDYLDLPETRSMLATTAGSGFVPSLCLLRAFAAWLKTSRAARSDEPKEEFTSGLKSLLTAAARIQGQVDDDTLRQLLDDVDKSLVDKGPTAEENLQLLRQGVVSHRLFSYIKGIENRIPNYFAFLQVPPLVLVLWPDYEAGESSEARLRWDGSAAKTIDCLLEQGQQPNRTFSTAETLAENGVKTPWVFLCELILPHYDDAAIGKCRTLQLKSAMEMGILQAFLSSGADVGASCKRPGRSASIVAADYLFQCFSVDAGDDAVLKTLYLQHLDWFLQPQSEYWNDIYSVYRGILVQIRSHNDGFGDSEFLTAVVERIDDQLQI